jgi:uncharacterized protein (DUF302 family)
MSALESGIVTIPSRYSVDETVSRLQKLLEAKGVHLFTIVDHSGEAERVGLKMPNTKLVVFGNPKAGTPLMIASPTIALDLPLKLLIWEDAESKCRITYNGPDYLRSRHDLSSELAQMLRIVGSLADEIAR